MVFGHILVNEVALPTQTPTTNDAVSEKRL